MKYHFYEPSKKDIWQGRIDQPQPERIHQFIELISLEEKPKITASSPCIIGFASDVGVRRNHGRPGAWEGPYALRKALANLCLHPKKGEKTTKIFDLGDVVCKDETLEAAQSSLGSIVQEVLAVKGRPLVLGGGHETAWGHFQGLIPSLKNKKLGVINFDAHFDLRPLTAEGLGHSGSPFRQIAEACKKQHLHFDYTCIGIQQCANTTSLFNYAEELGVGYILAEDIWQSLERSRKIVEDVCLRSDIVYVSLCLDVFSSAVAPGVSAPQAFGLLPYHVHELLQPIFSSRKLFSFDVVELSPQWDEDHRTARLGAFFTHLVLSAF